jgi:MFS family permease
LRNPISTKSVFTYSEIVQRFGTMSRESLWNDRRSIYAAIILFGIVSMMGDIVYEGSRGLVPDYLLFLGASAIIVGLVGGAGEFLGHVARLASGVLVDTTRAYWLFIFLGYGFIIAIPLLGVATKLELAIVLVLVERLGKAMRTPSRDTVLSVISKEVGRGKAFGLHELLDQIGGVVGPLVVAVLMFYTSNNYSATFLFLFIPFAALVVALAYTHRKIGSKSVSELPKAETSRSRLPRSFHLYTGAVLLNTVGLLPYTLILFKASVILNPLGQDWIVPLIYVLIMGVDAPAALFSGYAFDKYGLRVLLVPFALSIFPSVLGLFDSGLVLLVVAAAFYGLVLGMQESVYRAAVSEIAPVSSRGTAYGIFNTVYGVGFLISGAVFGFFISYGLPYLVIVAYTLATQIMAIVSLLNVHSKLKRVALE